MRRRLDRSACFVAVLLLTVGATAQTQPPQLTQIRETNPPEQVRTFYLTNVTDRIDAEEIMSDVRNLLPRAHAYYVPSQGALTVRMTAEEMAIVEKMLSELDRKRKVYKIIFTITQVEGGRSTGIKHIEMLVPVGTKTSVKRGNRVPIITGSSGPDGEKPNSQMQYVDVGLHIEADIEGTGEAIRLRSSIEESNLGDDKSSVAGQDPVIEQTRWEGSSILAPGKPALLGSLDLPGGTRHEEISVVSELVK